MARIFTRPPSREYDQGWDAIFGKKAADELTEEAQKLDMYEQRALEGASVYRTAPREALAEMSRIAQEAALETGVALDQPMPEALTETERELHALGKWLPGGGVRMPRGWTPGEK